VLCLYFVAFVLWIICCQFLWIVHVWLPLRYSLTFTWYNTKEPINNGQSRFLICFIMDRLILFYEHFSLVNKHKRTPQGQSKWTPAFVLWIICCQFLWIVHVWLPLRYSLTFTCPVSCVSYVASFSGLSIVDLLWIIVVIFSHFSLFFIKNVWGYHYLKPHIFFSGRYTPLFHIRNVNMYMIRLVCCFWMKQRGISSREKNMGL
jgi:hypothetical protein